jgi:hypothetical protein
MILPDKYTTFEESFLGLGAVILKEVGSKKMSTNELWNKLKRLKHNNLRFKKFIEILIFMYATKMLTYDNGEIYNENNKH